MTLGFFWYLEATIRLWKGHIFTIPESSHRIASLLSFTVIIDLFVQWYWEWYWHCLNSILYGILICIQWSSSLHTRIPFTGSFIQHTAEDRWHDSKCWCFTILGTPYHRRPYLGICVWNMNHQRLTDLYRQFWSVFPAITAGLVGESSPQNSLIQVRKIEWNGQINDEPWYMRLPLRYRCWFQSFFVSPWNL